VRPSTLGYAEQTTKPPLDECFILTLTVRVSPYIIISKLKEDSRGDGQRIDNWSFDYTDFVVGDSLGKKKGPWHILTEVRNLPELLEPPIFRTGYVGPIHNGDRIGL